MLAIDTIDYHPFIETKFFVWRITAQEINKCVTFSLTARVTKAWITPKTVTTLKA